MHGVPEQKVCPPLGDPGFFQLKRPPRRGILGVRTPWVVLRVPTERIAATSRDWWALLKVGTKGNRLSLWRICRTSEMFSRLCPRICGVYTTSWCTSITSSRDYCTPHGSAIYFTASLACASRGNCSQAQKSSVWLHLSRCVTVRKTHPWRGY